MKYQVDGARPRGGDDAVLIASRPIVGDLTDPRATGCRSGDDLTVQRGDDEAIRGCARVVIGGGWGVKIKSLGDAREAAEEEEEEGDDWTARDG